MLSNFFERLFTCSSSNAKNSNTHSHDNDDDEFDSDKYTDVQTGSASVLSSSMKGRKDRSPKHRTVSISTDIKHIGDKSESKYPDIATSLSTSSSSLSSLSPTSPSAPSSSSSALASASSSSSAASNRLSLSSNLQIFCNADGIIMDITDHMLTLLLFERSLIVDEFIGIIMSPFMCYLHKQILFPKYHKMNKYQKQIAHLFLSGKTTSKRPLIIYNIHNQPIYVDISVILAKLSDLKNYTLIVNFQLESHHNINESIDDNIYTKSYSNHKVNVFQETKNKIVIISIDFKGSTEFLVRSGTLETININIRFFDIVKNLILKSYYPYIYIHEIIGDCYIIALNMDWTYNIPNFCTSLAFSFLIDLYNLSKDLIGIRIGATYDYLYYGYMDNNLRFFGQLMNLSSRLESICDIGTMICDNNFVNKLFDENIYYSKSVNPQTFTHNLKGFGEISCNKIDLKSIETLQVIFKHHSIKDI